MLLLLLLLLLQIMKNISKTTPHCLGATDATEAPAPTPAPDDDADEDVWC